MKLGIYVEVLKNDLTGIGKYTYGLLKHLPRILKRDDEIVLFSKDNIKYNPLKGKVRIITENNELFRKIPSPIWYRYFSYRILNKENITHLWSPIPFLPKFLNKNVNKIVTVYDLNLYIVPETMKFRSWVVYKMFFKKSILEANKIIAISNGTSKKLHKYFNKNADVIIYPSIDEEILKLYKEAKKPFEFRYMLSVATLEPRKNISLLIDAFIFLKNKGYLKDIKLVLVGKYGWKNNNVLKKIKKYSSNDILYLGYVSKQRLIQLYKYAEVFIFPSKYEGFGIPVHEARNLGCCVITTDIEELKESCGEGCIYIKPNLNTLIKTLKAFFSREINCSYRTRHIYLWEEEVKKFLSIL